MNKRLLPIGIQTFRELREQRVLLRGQDRRTFDRLLHEGNALLPVAAPAVRQEPVPGHAEGGCSRAARRCSRGWPSTAAGSGRCAIRCCDLSFGGGSFTVPALRGGRALMAQLAGAAEQAGVRPSLRTSPRPERFAHRCWRHDAQRMPGSGWPCWWTSTTSRSWTRWWSRRTWRAPTATFCAGCTG